VNAKSFRECWDVKETKDIRMLKMKALDKGPKASLTTSS